MRMTISPTAYWPFDGGTISDAHLVESSGGVTATAQPILAPDQAFFLGRCVKSLYLDILCYFTAVDSSSNLVFGTIQTTNILKRYSVPGSNVYRVRFVAQPGPLAVTQFDLDFTKGGPGIGIVLGNTKRYGFLPKFTLNIASGAGTLQHANVNSSSGVLQFEGFPAFSSGAIIGLAFAGVASSPSYSIESVTPITSAIKLTERFDTIYLSHTSAYQTNLVSIYCPPVNDVLNTTAYRKGFADVTTIKLGGAPALVKGTTPSTSEFVLSASVGSGATAVLDTITFAVPLGAESGPIRLSATANPSSATSTSDFYETPELVIN